MEVGGLLAGGPQADNIKTPIINTMTINFLIATLSPHKLIDKRDEDRKYYIQALCPSSTRRVSKDEIQIK